MNYQSSANQGKATGAKMKQKYDEGFLNGPISMTDQQTLNYQDDVEATNSSAHNLANFNAKRYMHNQSMVQHNYDPNSQQAAFQNGSLPAQGLHKKSLTTHQ